MARRRSRRHSPAPTRSTPTPSRWIADDLQLGFRHFGFGVTGLDERAELLHEAGVRFHLEPLDATGGVRITFFYDPDGVLLEFIQGHIDYHKVWQRQSRRGGPRPPGSRRARRSTTWR